MNKSTSRCDFDKKYFIGSYLQLTAMLMLLSILLIFDIIWIIKHSCRVQGYIFLMGAYRQLIATLIHVEFRDKYFCGLRKMFCGLVIIINFNVINSIPAQALAAPFWFHIFFITAFFRSWPQLFLQLGCFWLGWLLTNLYTFKRLISL